MAQFWGLVLGSGKRYAQKVENGFCISMAVLESGPNESSQGSSVKLVLDHDNKQFILAMLSPKTPQLPLNVKFAKGETVVLYFQGGTSSQKLHLTGYMQNGGAAAIPFKGQNQSILITEQKSADKTNGKEKKRVSIQENVKEASSSEEDSDMDLNDDDVAVINKSPTLNDNSDDDDDDDDDDEDDSDDELQVVGNSRAAEVMNSLKQLATEDDSDSDEDDDSDDDDDDEDDDDEELEDSDDPNLSKLSGKGKNGLKAGTQPNEKQRKSEPVKNVMKTPDNQNLKLKQPSSAGHTPMKMFTKGGVMCQELRVGSGQPAKPGRMVHVYYVGRLKSNNKKFDSNESGQGFRFKLGKGEVIKGWDLGVEGMKVGGKRRLIIPANLAYGKRGAPPDIPPHSVLTFDVELKNVN